MKNIFSLSVAIILLVSCGGNSVKDEGDNLSSQFVNVLDIAAVPQNQYDLSAFGFSDLGAWHAYTLPNADSTKYLGGFCGPLLMKMHGQWIGKCLHRLVLKDENGNQLSYKPETVQLEYQPGILIQKMEADGIKVELKLIFTDNRTALIDAEIKNETLVKRKLKLSLEGDVWLKDLKVEKQENSVHFILPDSSFVSSRFEKDDFNVLVAEQQVVIDLGTVSIEKNASHVVSYYQSYFFNEQEAANQSIRETSFSNQLKSDFQENRLRWDEYLKPVVENLQVDDEKKLAVKSIQTLISNWRSPAGALKHNGVFPSTAYQGFYGFWSWDSWKHAVALVEFHPFLAKESIRSMFDFQNEAGMVADCVYYNPKENNWRDTKAPLAAWAIWRVFEESRDTAFVSEMYPKLISYHKWWYADRDHDQNGICEYGSTDGTLIAAKWESGMDNAVRFDDTEILKNHDSAWSFNQESVDLNAYLQKEKEYLSRLAEVIGKLKDRSRYKQEAADLAHQIRTHFWDEDAGYFFDRKLDGQLIQVYGPEGWTPLWTMLASKEQAEQVATKMLDHSRFNTKVPFPTLDASHPKFDPLDGYWRGPVWIDQVYFGIRSLENYGMQQQADSIKNKLFKNCSGLLTNEPIRENYHPFTGEGLNANHFSWSAAHFLLLLVE